MSTGKNHSEEKKAEGSTESSEKSRVPDDSAVSPSKKADNKGLDPLTAFARAMGQAQEALGHAQNELINAVTHADVEKRFSHGVSNALANDYKRGKELSEKRQQEGKSARPIGELSAADQRAIRSYQKVHEELPGQLPFYNKEALARDIDKLILSRSVKDEKPEPASKQPSSSKKPESEPAENFKSTEPKVAHESRKPEPPIKTEAARAPELPFKSENLVRSESLNKQAKIDSENSRPSLETNRPILENNRPILEADRPILEINRPMVIGLRPIWANEQPLIANRILEKPANLVNSEKPLTRSEPFFLQIKREACEVLQKYIKPLVVNGRIVIAPSPAHRPRYVIELPPSIPCQLERAVSVRPLLLNKTESVSKTGSVTKHEFEQRVIKEERVTKDKPLIKEQAAWTESKTPPVSKTDPEFKSEKTTQPDKGSRPETVSKPDSGIKALKPDSLIKTESVIKPDPIIKPDLVGKSDLVIKPYPVIKPDLVRKSDSVIKPDPVIKPDQVIKPNSVIKPDQVIKPDSVIKADTAIRADAANQAGVFFQAGQSPAEEQEASSTFVLKNRQIDRSDKYYISGGELVFAAIIALAGTARVRQIETLEPGNQIIQQQEKELEQNKGERDFYIESFNKGVQLRPTLMVLLSDTLNGLAERYLQDINLGWLIADLNRRVTQELDIDGKRVVRLKVRQILTLPTYSDIQRFYSVRTDFMSPSRLVTIVEDTQLSREVLKNTLSPFKKPG